MMRKVRDQPETAWVEPDQWSQWWQLGLQPKTDNTLRLNELKSCSIHQVMCLRKLRYRPNLNFPVNIQMTQRSHDGVAEPVSRPQVCRCRELKLQVSKRQPRNLKDFIPIKRSGPDSRWDVRKPRDQLQETTVLVNTVSPKVVMILKLWLWYHYFFVDFWLIYSLNLR